MSSAASYETSTDEQRRAQNLVLAALGVVYGDIGTSPLYAVRQAMAQYGEVGEAPVFGVLSLIAWALIIVVTVKYVFVIMRADNRGEGGLIALTALLLRSMSLKGRRYTWTVFAGILGTSLFYADGVITPAISVLSAVEGLSVATPLFDPYVVPIALVLLVALFAIQRRGTSLVGGLFGPLMVVWFVVLAILGIAQIVQNPRVLLALNPYYAIEVFLLDPFRGFTVLGAVFLAVTGTEALYADMGHFGRGPLKKAWLGLVFPALVLNYFGQGALVLAHPSAIQNPFFLLVPGWGLYPLVILASCATIIASQAVISGAFSLTRQAIQLGYLPRLDIRHTSEEEIGQVYIPRINLLMLVAVVFIVVMFQSSDNLGSAYGIAVTGEMIITTVLAYIFMRKIGGWSLALALPVFTLFFFVDAAFLGANLLKIPDGGWFTLVLAALSVLVMVTWRRGRTAMTEQRSKDALPLKMFLDGLRPDHPARVAGTAIYLTGHVEQVPSALLHSLKHYKSLHERVVLMTMHTEDVPRVPNDKRLEVEEHDKGFWAVKVHYGFMEQPSVPRALALCRLKGLKFELMETSFFIGRDRLRAAKRSDVGPRWRQKLFIFIANNALNATEFFGIPPNRAIEVGGHLEI